MEMLILALGLFFVAAVLAVLPARIVRHRWRKRHGVSRVPYPDGRFIDISRGVSVLEASRLRGVPHASVCGGRGRCSTCRSRIEGAPAAIPSPSAEEIKVLRRVQAGTEVRQGCQLRATGDIH